MVVSEIDLSLTSTQETDAVRKNAQCRDMLITTACEFVRMVIIDGSRGKKTEGNVTKEQEVACEARPRLARSQSAIHQTLA